MNSINPSSAGKSLIPIGKAKFAQRKTIVRNYNALWSEAGFWAQNSRALSVICVIYEIAKTAYYVMLPKKSEQPHQKRLIMGVSWVI